MIAATQKAKVIELPKIRVRNLYKGERLPKFTDLTGFENLAVIPEWVWVAEYYGRIVGAVFACNAHGLLILLRIVTTTYAPAGCLVPLLRQTFRDAKSRGLIGFVAQFQEGKLNEERLLGICVRAGAAFLPQKVINAFGAFNKTLHIWPSQIRRKQGKENT
jgi:hypothetical protein